MNKSFTIGLVVAVLLVAGGIYYHVPARLGTGATWREVPDFVEGIKVGTTRQFSISRLGVITNSGAFTETGALTASSGDNRITTPRQVGSVTAKNAAATTSITAATVCDSNLITWAPTVANASATLPTAAAVFADCLTTNGDTWGPVLFRNTSTAASTTIIVANTSTTLVGPTANDDVIDGGNEGVLFFYRPSATEMVVTVAEQVAAD